MTARTADPAAAEGFWLARQYNRLTLRQRRTLMGYVFIAPFILGFLFWWLGPAAVAGYLTFHKWNFLAAPKFVGMANFSRMVGDPILAQSLKVTIIFSLISVPLGLVFAFFLANLINAKFRFIAIFRTIYFLPSIVPAVANAILWAWLFNHRIRIDQFCHSRLWRSQDWLAARSQLGHAGFRHSDRLGRRRLDDHLPGRLARHPSDLLRSGRD